MDLETLTAGRYIRVGLQAADKQTAIGLLLDCLLEESAIPADSRAEVFEAVMTRERRLSTGLEAGIAIPHGQTDQVDRELAALGIFPDGVPFEALDGAPTLIVILLVTPPARRHRHVSNLGVLARQLMRPDVRGPLLSATSPAEVLQAIRMDAGDEFPCP